MLLTIPHIEALPFITQNGPDINPVPADSFTSTLLPGGILAVTNTSSKPMGGALVTCKTFLPPEFNTLALPYFGLDLDVCISPDNLARLGRLEIDIKRWVAGSTGTPLANIANCSSQLNRSTGEWQIDGNPPGWRNTGFLPMLSPCWTPLKFRYSMSATQFSVLSTAWDGCAFDVPTSMQNVTLETSKWGPGPGCVVQLQTEILEPGTLTVNFRNIRFTISDGVVT